VDSLEFDGVSLGIERSNTIGERLLEEVPRVRLHEAVLHENVLGLGAVDEELERGGWGQSIGELSEILGL
jgi:hypothetical protein